MYVVATAGHVDHGKSTLVHALTGMQTDRLAEEQRRGLTIDLGFSWTTLPSGRDLAFVDVPGHERFLGNMLAGVGPAPVVLFVVAADKGWQAQSTDHRDAVAALGLSRAVFAITRADRAPEQVAEVAAAIRAEFEGTPLAEAPIVPVGIPGGGTAPTGTVELLATLDAVLADAPAPRTDTRVRLWVDRAFTVKGSGTVATGTLTAGALAKGDALTVVSESGIQDTSVRGLHSQNAAADRVAPYARVAVNLRDGVAGAIGRGDALVTPDAWCLVDQIDVRRTMGQPFADGPQELNVHIGTAAVTARVRPFDDDHARLTLERVLPLELGDRFVLRAPGSRSVFAGATVLDLEPPELGRRGAGRARATALAALPVGGSPLADVRRRGAIRVTELERFGHASLATVPQLAPDASHEERLREVRIGEIRWWIHGPALTAWVQRLRQAVTQQRKHDPLSPGLPHGAARDALMRADAPAGAAPGTSADAPTMPDASLLPLVAHHAKLESTGGVLREPGATIDLGPAEKGVAALERGLRTQPFAAPEADDLARLKLGAKELATAERAGRVIRLSDGVILLPQAPALAMQRLAALPQPFTTSQARQALDTTRRVAIPLLELLDAKGWTRRVDGTLREVARR
ncbi:SelB C-terminal domain-containing protein [Leucobacter sp. cx-328]|uniref:selenocysteine-specific translation elongation factor n=1 Tax=unclassified Leucobacter TaxID=2621730 RepID=UPI00165D54F3|nr:MULTISPECIES: SelB C-terminal domain-containing protein [unclassified Leucobacter]MBC9943545.1 SelB C-terminal domain-containing protein [Leucobacter sp. cx-328]